MNDQAQTPIRRLARITVDVLLPTSYFDVDLADCEVLSVRIKGEVDPLQDIIASTIVPARLVPVES